MKAINFQPDFVSWRQSARLLLQSHSPPESLLWKPASESQEELFAHEEALAGNPPLTKAIKVSPLFLDLAERVSYHRDNRKWALLYRVLWRLSNGEPYLLSVDCDDDVSQLLKWAKAVQRDAHKMKAFVRFKKMETPQGDRYLAWHRPDHPIVKLVAPFFSRRFTPLHWSIFTPEESVHWDTQALTFGPGVPRHETPTEDGLDELWRSYYRSIFNPGRFKWKAMRKELPQRHWATLPESRVIAELVRSHEGRVARMVEAPLRSAKDYLPAKGSGLAALKQAAKNCRGCQLCEVGTQTVFGEGPETASIVLIGEQPGDEEDKAGRVFVGPAGKVLDEALRLAGLNRSELYLTNAVKHFKFKPVGKRRLHQKPRAGEIGSCQPWLASELAVLRPRVVVCLGATAAQAVLGRLVRVTEERGSFIRSPFCDETLITFHPSFILRAIDPLQKEAAFRTLVGDLKKVA